MGDKNYFHSFYITDCYVVFFTILGKCLPGIAKKKPQQWF
jgi:hypothetical protein